MGWFRRKKNEPFLSAENLDGGSAMRPEASEFESGQSRFSLVVEDVFTITGRGTVVTGKVASGRVQVGDRVTLLHTGIPMGEFEVEDLEVFGKALKEARAGQTVGIVLGRHAKAMPGDELRALSTAVGY